MDYEKRYKEALERARKIHNEHKVQCFDVMVKVFPELKESEDDMIREEIVDYLKKFIPHCDDDLVAKSKVWISWLEKQGQESKKVSIWKHWKNGIAGNDEDKQIYLIKVGNIYHLSSCLSFECDYIELSELDNLMFENNEIQRY